MRTSYRLRRSRSRPSSATQPSSCVMIASRGPRSQMLKSANTRSCSSRNSWPASSSASMSLGDTRSGPARSAMSIGSPSASTIGHHAEALHLGDHLGVAVVRHAAREAAREDAHVRGLPEVEQLVDEEADLLLGHLRARLVDLALDSGGRVDHRRRSARLVHDPHEVAEDRLLGQLLDDAGAGAPPGEAGRDHRQPERLQCPRDVDALPSGHRPLLGRAMPPADLEVGNGQRLVDRRVESDGDDHRRCVWKTTPQASVFPPYGTTLSPCVPLVFSRGTSRALPRAAGAGAPPLPRRGAGCGAGGPRGRPPRRPPAATAATARMRFCAAGPLPEPLRR